MKEAFLLCLSYSRDRTVLSKPALSTFRDVKAHSHCSLVTNPSLFVFRRVPPKVQRWYEEEEEEAGDYQKEEAQRPEQNKRGGTDPAVQLHRL